MKRVRRAMVAAVSSVAVVAASAGDAGAVAARTHQSGLQERLDRITATQAVGALAEVRDGHRRRHFTSGVAELDGRRPVPPHGRFRAGSITKTFLATVVLQLVGEGRLQLDDPVEAWLPGVVPHGEAITVHHLLAHTSGLHDVVRTLPMPPQPEFYDNRWRDWSAAELIRRALVHPPTFRPPGSDHAYSNTNYLLLGEIVKRATGRSHAAEIERRILRPLHLHATTMPRTSSRIRGPHPHAYVPAPTHSDRRLLDHTELNPSVFGAAGAILSTTGDLNRFQAALLGGRLLPDHLLEQMTTPGVAGATYGLGLSWRRTSCGVRIYGHSGDTVTHQSWSYSTPNADRQVTVAITPDFRGDPDDAVADFLDEAICGGRAGAIPGGQPLGHRAQDNDPDGGRTGSGPGG